MLPISRSRLSRLLLAFAFAPLAFAPAAAGEQGGDVIRKVSVPYADLDLETEEGAREFLTRLENAAYKACGGDPKLHSSYKLAPEATVRTFEKCRKDAIARTVDGVDVALVTKLHRKYAA